MATLVFYTCIYIPYSQAKQALLSILGFFFCLHQHTLECSDRSPGVDSMETCSIDLPMSQYRDLKINGCTSEVIIDGDCDDEACSVCLVEFESEDFVSKLSKCGHVFHMACIEKWVERNQFTCPLCRSSFLNVHGSKSHATCNSILSCL
ncbi:RING-H2 finger protein ATL79-like [Chenopodium quinoa]|uniref:RING-H2 finger protein ATL79-like n=1 Tax=Chenopodium quinoa TaxID=63459 RepID=UPI000B76EFF9|nr:RING-H2 finger protein ATL79-like [Chenopodium quinoa]